MFEMSIQTAMFILFISSLIGLLGITFMFMRFKLKYQGLTNFLVFYFLNTVGVVLTYFRGSIDTNNNILFSNITLLVANLFFFSGVMRLYGLKFRRWSMAVMSAGYLFVIWYYTFEVPDISIRIIVYSITSTLVYFIIVLKVLRRQGSKGFGDLIVPVSLLIVINFSLRGVLSYIYLPTTQDILTNSSDAFSVSVMGILNVMLLGAAYAIIADRSFEELEQANKNEQFYSNIYFSSPIPVLIGKSDGEFLHFNEALMTKLGTTLEKIVDLRWDDYCSEEHSKRILTEVSLLVPGQKSILYGIDILTKDGTFPAEIFIHRSIEKEEIYEAYIIDLSGNKHYIDQMLQLNKSKEGLLGTIPGFAYRCKVDDNYTMELLSDSFFSITGYLPSEIINNKLLSYNDLILPEYRNSVKKEWDRALEKKDEFLLEYKILCKNGTAIWVWERGSIDILEDGKEQTFSGFISDITYRKEVEGALEYLSYHDSMTGLYNRRFMEEEIRRLDVQRNLPFTVVQLDIDSLKFTNDAFGHNYGDELIFEVAKILKKSLRQDEIVGRMGGDEFLILLPKTPANKAEIVVERIVRECMITTLKTRVSVSVGTATKTSKEESFTDILQFAEEKMYSNKMFKKDSISEQLVDSLLEELYSKFPDELENVNNTAKEIIKFANHLDLSKKRLESILKACRLHRLGLLAESKIAPDCVYQTEETYRMIRSIPGYHDIAEVVKGYCEHYDGTGHPEQKKSDEISIESQVLALCSYIAMNGLHGVTKETFKVRMKDKIGTWFDPKIIDSYIEMISK